jgi:hypothetical protein
VDWLIRYAQRCGAPDHINGYMERFRLAPVEWWLSARVHHILRSDKDDHFHDHPWAYLTIILRGEYTEVKPCWDKSGFYNGESRRTYKAGSVMWRSHNSWHRLELPPGETAWTLFITGRYRQRWGFLMREDYKMSYREYFRRHPGSGN